MKHSIYRLAAAALLLMPSPSLWAQSPTVATASEMETIRRQLQDLIKARERDSQIIADLTARLAQVGPAESPGKPGADGGPSTAPFVDLVSASPGENLNATEESAPLLAPRLDLRFYGDLGFHTTRSSSSGTANTFGLGQMDLFATSRLSSRFSVLMETVFEHDGNETTVDLERLLLQYRHSDYLNVEVGKFHTGIGYYNTAFHHGGWFQTAVERPFIFNFEDGGGVLPMHNVGVSVNGRLPSGGLGLHYLAEVGNGRGYGLSAGQTVQNSVDENRGKAVNVGLSVQPDRWRGFQAGATWYRDRLTPLERPAIRQNIFALYAVYSHRGWEVLNEAIWMRHAQETERRRLTTVPAFYSQVGRRFGHMMPYFRTEYMNASSGDPVAGPVLGEGGWRRSNGGGMLFDLTNFASLKLQAGRVTRRALPAQTGFAVQLAFAF